jgi:transcriptional regulator with XRE-family HTH domain
MSDNVRVDSVVRREELGGFLRARRARLSPQDCGLAPGTRRRTPGLRREEVALLAGVGVTWYTWLEQGRRINVSDHVLDAVARALQLGAADRAHLHHLAGRASERSPAAPVPRSIAALLRSFEPAPAVLVDARYDIRSTNQAHRDLFRDWHTATPARRNLLWTCLTVPAARERCLNYDAEMPYLIGRLRAEFARHVDDPEWNAVIRQFRRGAPEFARMWDRHDVAGAEPRERIFTHPAAGVLRFETTELHIGGSAGLHIIAYTPLDESTAARLPRIRC